MPIHRFTSFDMRSSADADALFDGQTQAIVEMRFDFQLTLAVRMHYYRQPPGTEKSAQQMTELVRAHEEKHLLGAQRAWMGTVGALEPALTELNARINNALNLQGGDAFVFERSDPELTNVWRLAPAKKSAVNTSAKLKRYLSNNDKFAIPTGLLEPKREVLRFCTPILMFPRCASASSGAMNPTNRRSNSWRAQHPQPSARPCSRQCRTTLESVANQRMADLQEDVRPRITTLPD